MFQKDYAFLGKHAEYVKRLTSRFSLNDDENISIFTRNIDVYIISSIIGAVYGRFSQIDKLSGSDGSSVIAKIATSQLVPENERINYCYEIVMLLHDKNKESIETRLERAFKYYNKDDEYKKECFRIFNGYILGGVEVLYEKIFESGQELEEYLVNLYEFFKEFNIKYNSALDENIESYYD